MNEQYLLALARNFLCSAEKSYERKLLTPGWYRVNLRVSQTVLNHTQNLFLIVSVCLASLQKFFNGKSDAWEELICIVQRAH